MSGCVCVGGESESAKERERARESERERESERTAREREDKRERERTRERERERERESEQDRETEGERRIRESKRASGRGPCWPISLDTLPAPCYTLTTTATTGSPSLRAALSRAASGVPARRLGAGVPGRGERTEALTKEWRTNGRVLGRMRATGMKLWPGDWRRRRSGCSGGRSVCYSVFGFFLI